LQLQLINIFIKILIPFNSTSFSFLLVYYIAGDNMKTKGFKIVILCFIVFMMGGILSSMKDDSESKTSTIISEFDEESEYNTGGYTPVDPNAEDNVNIIGRINCKIGEGMSNIVNKSINSVFQLLKKLIS